jgi:hypothetical protein
MAVRELVKHLKGRKVKISYQTLADYIQGIAVTLRRELSLMKIYCLEPTKDSFFALEFSTFGPAFATAFPSAVFEIDEAGKCHALSRSTASVFHLMRAMEVGIGAVAACLQIPPPVKAADKNWGKFLKAIKDEMDDRSSSTPPRWGGK